MSASFVDRIIYQQIVDGLQPYLDDPASFERFLVDGGLSASEAAKGREFIVEHPPNVVLGYPRMDGHMPCWALTVGGESTAQDYLGEAGSGLDEDGELMIGSDGLPIACNVRRWEHRYDIFIYVQGSSDPCMWYYHLLKHLMVASLPVFQDAHLDEITYSGAELAPDPRYQPTDIYVRRFSMTCRSDQDYADTSGVVGPGRSVSGIHAEDADDATVTHNVIPYVE